MKTKIIPFKIKKGKKQVDFPEHDKLIYQWDSTIWNAPLTEEDALRVTHAIILRAAEDETNPVAKEQVNRCTRELNRHNNYIKGPNLKYDCDMSGINYGAILAFFKMKRLFREW